jgi:hypothetical protein
MDFEPTAPQIELRDVGWKPVFQQQLVDYPEDLCPARVVVVQRTGLTVAPAFNGRTDVAIGGRFYLEYV